MHRRTLVSIAVAFLAGGMSVLHGAVIASSTFDTNAEGWTNGNFDATTPSPGAVNYLSTGGNPGGHIQISDVFGWNAFLAPASYLGNQSGAYLGSLSFDLYDTAIDAATDYPAVMISDGTTFLFSPLIPTTSVLGPPFQRLTVQFQASTGWSTTTDGVPPATEAEMQTVLANLQILAIDADWKTGPDDVHLDNVVLSGPGAEVPEPVTVMLIAPFAVWLALRRRSN
jgi:hypothetical protein